MPPDPQDAEPAASPDEPAALDQLARLASVRRGWGRVDVATPVGALRMTLTVYPPGTSAAERWACDAWLSVTRGSMWLAPTVPVAALLLSGHVVGAAVLAGVALTALTLIRRRARRLLAGSRSLEVDSRASRPGSATWERFGAVVAELDEIDHDARAARRPALYEARWADVFFALPEPAHPVRRAT